jgi:monoamine oxidase
MCSVIVVGAGAAGLTAAYDIKMQSACAVLVLEASNVHGGRVKKDDTLTDFPIDLGGEWIDSTLGVGVLDEIVNNDSVPVNVDTFSFALPHFIWFSTPEKFIPAPIDDPLDFGLKFKNSTWYDFLTDYIWSELNVNEIRYSCTVESIDYSDSALGVQVGSTCGPFQADRVVVAVSLTVLQDGDITFIPDLPEERKKVLKSVDMPPAVKVFLKFSEKFYPDSFALFSDIRNYPGDEKQRLFYDESFGQDSIDNVMGLFSYGKSAEDFYADLSNGEIFVSVMKTLDEIFDGEASDTIEDFVVQNWYREAFIRGGYSSQNLKQAKLVKIIQKPLEDRVYFAGEYIPDPSQADGYGFVQSGCFSGRYAVGQLLDSF